MERGIVHRALSGQPDDHLLSDLRYKPVLVSSIPTNIFFYPMKAPTSLNIMREGIIWRQTIIHADIDIIMGCEAFAL